MSRAGAVKVGRRSDFSSCPGDARPHLDSSEHGSTLVVVGMTMSRGARLWRTNNRAATLYSVGPMTRTMMQSCASAAKLRGGGPILHNGMKAMVFAGPRHLEPSSAPHRGADRDRQAIGRRTFNSPCSSRRAHRDTLWNHALPHQSPQRDQELAGQCHNHGLAGFRCMLRTSPIPLR